MTQLHGDLTGLVTGKPSVHRQSAIDAPRVCAALTGLNDVAVITAATRLTADLQGWLCGCFVPQQIDPYAYAALVGPYALPVRIAVDDLHQQNQTSQTAARQAYDAVTAEHAKQLAGHVPVWRGDLSGAEELGLVTRLMDFIVMVQPHGANAGLAMACLDSVLYRARRSALLVPPDMSAFEFSDILVAFNGSAEAARAVSTSLPILRRANKIFVLCVGRQPASTPGTDELIGYLESHGVSASVTRNTRDESVESSIDRFTQDLNINLVVMGAYTHTHLRQKILGGLTTHMLKHAKSPVLLAH